MTCNIVGITGQLGSGKDTVADVFVTNGFTKVSLANPIKTFVKDVFQFTDDQLWGPSDLRNHPDLAFEDADMWASCWDRLQKFNGAWVTDLLNQQQRPYVDRYEALYELDTWFNILRTTNPILSPRICLQTLGTEWGRNSLYPNIWVDYMYRSVEELVDQNPNTVGVVVPDLRFENELRFFKEQSNCKLIRVIRPGTDAAAESAGLFRHKSEMEQKLFADNEFDVVLQNSGTLKSLLENAEILARTYSGDI